MNSKSIESAVETLNSKNVESWTGSRFNGSTIQRTTVVTDERHASLRQNLEALPRGAWILFLGTFINKFGAFVLPFLAIYMTRLGYSTAQAGLAIGAYGIGTLGACFLGGHLADRLGRRKTIVLSMFSGAVALLCLSQARGLPVI